MTKANLSTTENNSFFVGQPIYQNTYGKNGYISAVEENKSNTYIIGAKMESIELSIDIVYDDGTMSRGLAEQTVAKWADAARQSAIQPEAVEVMVTAANAKQEEYRKQQARKKQTDEYDRAKFLVEAEARTPSWAKAVITATRHINDCDSMTDYFGHKTAETVILGFSKHTRDLFPELRKSAANYSETENLSVKPEKPEGANEYWTPEDEHREKYSMGSGYYLGVYKNHDGWVVSKDSIKDYTQVPTGIWSLGDTTKPKTRTVKSTSTAPQGVTIEQHTHTKKGFEMSIVLLADRVSREEYLSLLDQAKSLGGWYSRKWGSTPAGFAFKEEDSAKQFADSIAVAPQEAPNENEPAKKTVNTDQAEKLRVLADKMQSDIDSKLADRQTNTAKRLAQANHARLEGERLQRAQTALRGLADLHDAGQVPEELQGVKSKKAIIELVGTKTQQTENGYHSFQVCTGERRSDSPEAIEIWKLLKPKSAEEKAQDDLRRKIDDLQFSKIPGYFPTPEDVVKQMIDLADVEMNHSVLEPSAGGGAITDGLSDAHHEGIKTVYEVNHTLCEVLRLKGFDVSSDDFMEQTPPAFGFDRVLMNPPFENLQDVDHVRHAFKFLKPGGRLVAVMSPSGFFRADKKSTEFRYWFEELGGEKVVLPEGSFKDSGTGVNTVLIVIDKD